MRFSFDTPPGLARAGKPHTRFIYWRDGKRLGPDGVVALLWNENDRTEVFPGIVRRSERDILTSSARAPGGNSQLQIDIAFDDPTIEARILERYNPKSTRTKPKAFIIDVNIMFESIRPFLQSLQELQLQRLPFAKYFVHPSKNSPFPTSVDLPRYSDLPGFTWDLSCLCKGTPLFLKSQNSRSIFAARVALKQRSRLDAGQADALIDCLTREVSLIQGPPGTGKVS